jgi:hypothetical protein
MNISHRNYLIKVSDLQPTLNTFMSPACSKLTEIDSKREVSTFPSLFLQIQEVVGKYQSQSSITFSGPG